MDPRVHVVVESEAVRAAHEPDVVGPQQGEDSGSRGLKPQSGCGAKWPSGWGGVCMRTTRCGSSAGLEAPLEEAEVVVARPACAFRRSGARHLDLADDAWLGVQGDEPGVPVGELEVHRAVNAGERVPPVPVVEVVVADDADVGEGRASTSRR